MEWKTVNYSHSYENPIVVAKPIESCADRAQEMCDSVVVRVKNVTPNSFEVKLQTWGSNRGKDLSSPHKVQYLVIEEGHYSDIGGFEIEAGKFTLTLGILEDMFGGAFAQVAFQKDFSEKPVVFTSVATFVGENPVVTRNKKVSTAGFKTRLSEQGQRWIGNLGHKNEEIHYIAVTPGNGEIGDYKVIVSSLSSVNHVSSEAVFQRAGFRSEPIVVADMQTNNGTDPSALRYTNKTKLSTKFFVAEDGLLDYSFRHLNGERVGYMAIGIPPIYAVSPVIEADPTECKEAPCEVNFNGLSSYSNAGSIVSFEWDFGDCTEGSGGTVSHTYEAPGAYVVTLTTTDELGNQGTDSVIINVGKTLPLKAVIEHSRDGAAGHIPCQSIPCSVSFDGSKSKGDIVSYEWDFHDGSTQTGKTAEFTYEEFGEFPVTLTVKDDGGETDSVTTIVVVRKVDGLIVLEPMETITVHQNIKNVPRPDKVKALSLGLAVQYTDLFGSGKKITKNHRTTEILLANLKSGLEKFRVKLELRDQTQCVGWNDVYGVTGEQVAPKVLFDWSFNSSANQPVAIDQCDKKASGEFTYCDATQFSISLLKKLHKIDELAQAGELGISELEEFKAYLMADNFSEDFRKDFDYYYQHGFLNAPSWYTDLPEPWSAYFTDFERLKFEPAEITEPGLYKVTLEFTFEGEEYEFFSEGSPAATIIVKFEKVHDLGIEVIDSPFYHLPFDGLVGTMREDSDGKVERKDYGIGFENEDSPLSVSYADTDLINTIPQKGKLTYLTRKENSFQKLNLSERGKVLNVNILDGVIEFAPSYAMPVIMGIKSVNDQAQAFYIPSVGNSMLEVAGDYAAYWTGIATSPYLECTDFMLNPLPYNLRDSRANSFTGVCPLSDQERNHAFGFKWANVVKNDEKLFLKTVFYSAFQDATTMANACSSPEKSISIFASPFDMSTSPGQIIALQTPDGGIETFKDLKERIAESRVCMSANNGQYTFFWNPEKVEEKLEGAKRRIEEQWLFNWENYKCNPFE